VTEQPRVLGIEHVTVTTPEELVEEVRAWYSDTLGLTVIDNPSGRGGRFQVGSQELHLLLDPHNPPKSAHFCLQVEDFDSFVASLRANGCHIEQARAVPGRRRCFTRDPAGNSIEIVALQGDG
jgi:catechol 2,3-dioxygenase-like lactoylglutathione lyase family enzyme